MSKKNSSVILKNGFKNFKEISKVFLDFKNKINKLKNKSFLIAVSGGSDSLALTALSKAYSYEKKVNFKYVLINHNIRTKSAKEAKDVKKLLKKYNINLKIITNKVEILNNIQSKARQIRYKKLSEYCLKNKIKTIITAHNLEDQVETFFIRLSRGSGLTGLSSMTSISKLNKNLNLLRPLLNTKKTLLRKISLLIFGKYFKDPSNDDLKYLRTKIRSLKNPLKQRGIEYSQIIKSINNLAASKKTLDQYFISVFKETIKKQTTNEVILKHEKFKKLNDEAKLKIINYAIKIVSKKYYVPRSKKVLNLIKNLKIGDSHKYTLGGCLIVKNSDYLVFRKEKSRIS